MNILMIKPPARVLRLLLWLVLATVVMFSQVLIPALFRSETTLQIRTLRQGVILPDGFYVYQTLNAQGIHIKSITPDHDSLVIKFDSLEQSIAAEKVLRELLPYGFDIDHQRQRDTSGWLNRISIRT